jgi:hypothetical protein
MLIPTLYRYFTQLMPIRIEISYTVFLIDPYHQRHLMSRVLRELLELLDYRMHFANAYIIRKP